MTTRREFLKRGAALSLAGMVPIEAVVKGSSGPIDARASEMLYLGRPMNYWLTRLNRSDLDPEFIDGHGNWVLVLFGDKVVPHLIESLKQRSPVDSVTQLFFMGSPRTVRLLSLALEHSHPRVRAGAMDALVTIAVHRSARPQVIEPLGQALPAIAKLLNDNNSGVSYRARHFLELFASQLDPSFIAPIDGLDNPRAAKRANAVRMLAKRPAEEAIPLLEMRLDDSDSSVRWEAAEQLSKFDPDHPGIVPVFIDYLIRREHITAIGFSGLDRIIVKALPTLQEALKSEGPKVRRSILHGLAWSRSDAVLPTSLEMLNDHAPAVRCAALAGLFFMKTDAILPHLIRALEDKDDSVQAEIRWVFKRRPALARQAVPELMKVLEFGNPSGQVSAALIIAELGHEGLKALPLLRQTLQHSDSVVRLAAAIAIAHIRPKSPGLAPILFTGLSQPGRDIADKAVEALEKMGKELKSILPQLIDGLKHDSLRGISVNLLSTILAEATQAVPHLIDLLKTRNGNLGCYVPAALASAGSKAIPPLAKLMEHEEIFVRARAIKTIGLIGGPASSMVPRLIQKLNTGSILERVAAAGALGNIGPTGASVAVPALKAAVRDRDIALRCAAIEALGKLKGQAESAISDLCDFLNESLARQIKWRALTALKNIGVAGVPRLLQALKNADEEVRRFAAGQLSEFGKVIPSVVPALIECLGDADAGVRASAVESLEKIGSRAVVARSSLEQLLRDPCEIVRERTKVALNAMST